MNADGSDITTEQEHKQSPDDFPPVNSHKIQNTLYSKHDSYQKLRNWSEKLLQLYFQVPQFLTNKKGSLYLDPLKASNCHFPQSLCNS